jgi:hypothetical protein
MKTKHAALVTGVLLIGLGITLSAVAQEDEQYAAVAFVVLRDYNGKPVKNASVIMHPVKKNGKQKNSGLQLKTNTEGKTTDGVPYGLLCVSWRKASRLSAKTTKSTNPDGDHDC